MAKVWAKEDKKQSTSKSLLQMCLGASLPSEKTGMASFFSPKEIFYTLMDFEIHTISLSVS